MPAATIARARSLRRSQPATERILWKHLRDRCLEGLKFRRQVPIGPYVVDFACLRYRVIVEADGPFHDPAADSLRDTWLASQGFRVLRFSNDEIGARDRVLGRIMRPPKRRFSNVPSTPHPARFASHLLPQGEKGRIWLALTVVHHRRKVCARDRRHAGGEDETMRIAAILGALAALAAGAAQAQADKPVTVKIDSGPVVGVATDKANVFRNIPFAAAPVGALRWAPPQAVKPWTAPRPAAENGPSCPQPMNADGSPNGGGANGPISEDCLQLNVFAPKTAKGAPVMVWIHGGAHVVGAGWIYGGENFARDGAVVVSINYRLGALGYFATPEISAAAKPGEPTGNFGLMDQIAALKWVQRNIAAFGGDPKNVTVFGESAGGMSTLAVLSTPAAKGLYAKAIVESGAGWFQPKTLAMKEKEGAAALQKAGITTTSVGDLRAVPAEKLALLPGDYQPFIDGKLMTETPSQALANGHFADVPLIIGSNSGEDSLMGPGPAPAPAKARMLAAIPPAARATAYKDEAAAGDEVLARAIFTDLVMGGPARWVAAKASTGKPSYLYYFSYVGSRFPASKTRASHADEIQYAWEYWGRRTPASMINAKDQEVASLMHACWVSFARTSVPKCGSVAWPAYTPAADQLMEFGKESGVRTHLRKTQLDAQEAAALPTLALGAGK